mmetsp:Transcript_9602/g.8583  ORF Transcript_9602/g.8583 Transcript_9602/m.8583 type:complete len:165 (-) Transcript_9602:28-522(-)
MEGKSQEWIDQTEGKIREMFDLFDKDKTDSIVQEEIGTVMRALGVFPSERALVLEILPDMQDDEPTGFVSYEKFKKKMLTILATNEWEPDSSDILLQAFRTIDEENKGYITSDVIEELLTSRGTPLRNIELESFLSIAKDPETGFVYYEDYVSLLTKNISNKKK